MVHDAAASTRYHRVNVRRSCPHALLVKPCHFFQTYLFLLDASSHQFLHSTTIPALLDELNMHTAILQECMMYLDRGQINRVFCAFRSRCYCACSRTKQIRAQPHMVEASMLLRSMNRAMKSIRPPYSEEQKYDHDRRKSDTCLFEDKSSILYVS